MGSRRRYFSGTKAIAYTREPFCFAAAHPVVFLRSIRTFDSFAIFDPSGNDIVSTFDVDPRLYRTEKKSVERLALECLRELGVLPEALPDMKIRAVYMGMQTHRLRQM
jgi:hypothetical protein